eukprot:TRINITY_DN10989_c0_g1_i3.p1 TRINITY_DN10989_c0_g1~~TRINITY_DN10989_c0_g1_i3.p1  ORF type:complete len:292 (+),score=3.53 TRINITY_DN10989_c0_g1_i3:62-937(+)
MTNSKMGRCAMWVLVFEVSKLLEPYAYSTSTKRSIITFVTSVARRTKCRIPIDVLLEKVKQILHEAGPDISNKTLGTMGSDFRKSLQQQYEIRSSTLEEGHTHLVNIIARMSGRCPSTLSNSHIYRIKILWCVLHRFGISKMMNQLSALFPCNILEFITFANDKDCPEWHNFLGTWVVQMFYFRKYNHCKLLKLDVCMRIWKVFSSWEKVADLPLEITFLDYETLATFLPSDPTGCLVTWEREYEQSALARLCDFPFHDITTVPAHYYVLNPYTEKGYEFVSGFYLFLYRD